MVNQGYREEGEADISASGEKKSVWKLTINSDSITATAGDSSITPSYKKTVGHIYRLFDKVGVYILLALSFLKDRGKATTRHGLMKLIENSLGDKFHHSVYTLRLSEFLKIGLVNVIEQFDTKLYTISDKGEEVLNNILNALLLIDQERWIHNMDALQREIKHLMEKKFTTRSSQI